MSATISAHPIAPLRTVLRGVEYLLVAAILFAALLLPFTPVVPDMISLPLTVLFAVIHGTRRYGVVPMLSFFLAAVVISNGFETLSILTGVPFGHYYYTWPGKIYLVPFGIGPIYFGIAYVSWIVTCTVLGCTGPLADRTTRRARLEGVALPLVAGAVMTMFDVGSDSLNATLVHNWIWRDGGGLFGVPYTNYLGWWLVTYLFFQVFALVLWRGRGPAGGSGSPAELVAPTLVYLAMPLTSIMTFVATPPGAALVSDAAGTAWNIAALTETMMIIHLFGMMSMVLIAGTNIATMLWSSGAPSQRVPISPQATPAGR